MSNGGSSGGGRGRFGYGGDDCGGGGGRSSGGQRGPTNVKTALVLPCILRRSETEGLVSPLPAGCALVGALVLVGLSVSRSVSRSTK